jgi:hypothetical protein
MLPAWHRGQPGALAYAALPAWGRGRPGVLASAAPARRSGAASAGSAPPRGWAAGAAAVEESRRGVGGGEDAWECSPTPPCLLLRGRLGRIRTSERVRCGSGDGREGERWGEGGGRDAGEESRGRPGDRGRRGSELGLGFGAAVGGPWVGWWEGVFVKVERGSCAKRHQTAFLRAEILY